MDQLDDLEHHVCEFVESENTVFIECSNCIYQIKDTRAECIYNCSCIHKKQTVKICMKCHEIQNNIQSFQEELDALTNNMSAYMQNYLNHTNNISITIRQYRRILLEKNTA